MTIAQRNYNAFKYLLKKKPREYRGIYVSQNMYVGFHIYIQANPGSNLAKLRELFRIESKEMVNAD